MEQFAYKMAFYSHRQNPRKTQRNHYPKWQLKVTAGSAAWRKSME
jgi:hypothetical protein